MDIKIVDNFMPEDVFLQYSKNIIKIPWYGSTVITEGDLDCKILCDSIDNFQFIHVFYGDNTPKTEQYYKFIEPLLSHIKIRSLIRAKINLNPRTEKIIQHGYHIDNKFNDSFTAILYLNTNNGYTEFENGTKVESIENRLVTFPSFYKHTGSTCTDKPYRIGINLNYF